MTKSTLPVGAPAGLSGYITLLTSNRDYRLLWLGEVVSLFGDWFNLIASAALISRLTSSGLAVGGLFVVRMLAPFLVSPLAGVVADRYNRKRLLVMTDLLRAVVVMGFLLVREPQQVWLLYALTAVQLGLSGMFFPARNAILPDIVTRQQLGAANALSSATWSVMLALGSAVGGVVAGRYGIYASFVIDAVTFLVSAVLIASIAYRHTAQPASSGGWRQAGRQYLEGLNYLAEHKSILMIAIQKGLMAMAAGGAFQVVQVVIAERVFVIGEGGSTSLGIQYAVAGIGTGLGPILARRFSGDQDTALRRMLLWAWALSVLGILITASMASFGLVLIGQTLRAVGTGINWVFTTQLLLQKLPDGVRGRVFSTEFALFSLASAIAAYLGGWLFDTAGMDIQWVLWLMALASALCGAIWLLWLLRGRHA
jgi:MFS family permease